MSGYIKIHRTLFDHPVVGFHVPAPRAEKGKRPVPPFMAWEWLCAKAAFKPHQSQDNRGNVAAIERGQVLAGRAYLADQWGWTEQNVRTFLKKLRDHGMVKINQASNRATAIISICNYEKFQGAQDLDNQQTNQAITKPSPSPNHTEEREEGKEKKEASSARTREDEFGRFIDRELIEWVSACLNPFAPEATHTAEQILRGHAKLYPPSQIAKGLNELRTAMAGSFKPRDFGKAMSGYIGKARPVTPEQPQASAFKLDVYDRMVPTNVEPVDDVWSIDMQEVRHAH